MKRRAGGYILRTFLAVLLLVPAIAAASHHEQVQPLQDRYLGVLQALVDQLVSTQITDPDDPDFGALISPSTNPQPNPRHSRAAEAVYPLAVMYRHGGEKRYLESAVRLGNWLLGIQQDDGAWGENWPNHDGWTGTTADQLISLAGALELLGGNIGGEDREAWVRGITMAADFSVGRFGPGRSNINYIPTAAVGLVLAHRAVDSPKTEWLDKAAELMDYLDTQVNEDQLIVGEGKGVDLGYNIAQTIGFMAWYGILQDQPDTVDRAAALLKSHMHFMYPNGAIDNSWGTRSFKWTLESGTKTAPGVHFTFALLADRDPAIHRGAQLALDWLENHALDEHNRVVYGPHAYLHANSSPPSNYGTFARAQSIATALEYLPETGAPAPIPAEHKNWTRHFPTVGTAIVRTDRLMATLSAYANNGRYPLETAVRGGSATVVWFEGYGPDGFLQVSSQTEYKRIENKHMPDGIDPLPLTPRIESTGQPYRSNLFDAGAKLETGQLAEVTTSGHLRTIEESPGPAFTWKHEFAAESYSKTLEVDEARDLQIVEPFVDNPGNRYTLEGTDTFVVTQADGQQWQLKVDASTVPFTLVHGEQKDRYYVPFPGFNAYPLHIRFEGEGAATLRYSVSARQ
jgi:hypothetical protein